MSDRLAELYVEITAKTDKLEAGLKAVKQDTEKMGSTFGATAVAMGTLAAQVATKIMSIVPAIQAVIKKSIEWADNIKDDAIAYGMTTDQVQKLAFMEQLEGASKGKLIEMGKRMVITLEQERTALGKVTKEAKPASSAFQQLGIDIASFSTLNTYEQLDMLARKLIEIKDIPTRISLAQQIVGKGGDIDLIMGWIDNMDKANQMLKDFGFTQEQIDRVASYQTNLGMINASWDRLGMLLMTKIDPKQMDTLTKSIISIADALAKLLNDQTFVENLAILVQGFTDLANAITAVITAYNNSPAFMRKNPHGDTRPFWEMPQYQDNAMASGGIVTQPTRALIGESGPEAIIPLSQMGSMGGGVTVNVGSYFGDEISKRALVRDIQRILNEENRRSSYKPTETSYYSVGGHL